MNAPVALFLYNRPLHAQRVLKSLAACDEASKTELYIYSDGALLPEHAKDVAEVRRICHSATGFAAVHVIEEEENHGIAGSCIKGVNEVLSKFSKVIVIDDCLEMSPFFLKYMNSALNYYQNYGILSISGYTPPIEMPRGYDSSTFVMHRTCPWGWGTWREQWQKIDWEVPSFDAFIRNAAKLKEFNSCGHELWQTLLRWKLGEIDDWSIRFTYAGYLFNEPTVYPRKSLVRYVGSSASVVEGTCLMPLAANVGLSNFASGIAPNAEIVEMFRTVYNMPITTRILCNLKRLKYIFFDKK